ncbi:claudin-4-like [Betta splendens]|uniref:Claudin n=1 Tax=Betta splendens TaxID=158456 RepID=A0A6P7PDH9_BETSP|nr:claudin-4-like [Betta splendens]
MVSGTRQIAGLSLAVVGFLGTAVICALPIWCVTKTISGIVGPRMLWEGLWMHCFGLSGHKTQCRLYSGNAPRVLQAARALVVVAILFGFSAIVLVIVGGTRTSCIRTEKRKCQVHCVAGVLFIIAGLLVLIPVCWTANDIVRPQQHAYDQVHGLGAALYVGWGAAGLLVLGGGLLCTCKKNTDSNQSVRFMNLKSECED